MSEPTEFDLLGPLPGGTTVLEASAGTGKTYAIAALAARYIVERDIPLDQIMLVTFGRLATNELRSRVHERLVSLAARMADALADRPGSDLDALERWLIEGARQGEPPGLDRDELVRRHERVARALADFDAATIATTHEFCRQMLDGLGVLGDREPTAQFVEQLTDLTREVATDLYLSRYSGRDRPPMTVDEAVQIATAAVDAVHTRLVPDARTESNEDARERASFATAARTEVERRKRSGRLFTYDDLLTRLQAALADPRNGHDAARRLQQRYQIVLVDEFQDTDPIQWDILRRAFAGVRTLVLIGDPKQAIYAFRGADVYSYLDAVDRADSVMTLGTNWRSDADLLDALETLMGGAALGEEQIVVRPVRAEHQRRRLMSADASAAAPVRLRIRPHALDAESTPSVATIRPQIQADLVADIVEVLDSDLQLDLGQGPRKVLPADIAVLVRKNERGEAIRDALVAAGVPAVMHGASSVFASPMAQDWLTLLVALEQPRQQAVRQAARTCFFGWSITDLAEADENALTTLSQQVRSWSRLLPARGVAALLEAASTQQRVPERLLGQIGGERSLTDLRHLAQTLHAAKTSGQLGVSALVEWLRDRMAEAAGSSATDGSRRLETDAAAVTILTVHRSKGLEFPLVYLPEAWDRHVGGQDEGRILKLHETTPEGHGDCVLDVGGRPSDDRASRFSRHQQEEAGEDLRLTYVAMTRAQCQVVAWWAPSHNTPSSALQRFLGREAGETGSPAPAYRLHGDPFNGRSLGSHIALEQLQRRTPRRWQAPRTTDPTLTARVFDRVLDREWRRTSYSALTAAVHGLDRLDPAVGSEPEVSKEIDEPVPSLDGTTPAAPAPAPTSPALPSTASSSPAGAGVVSPMGELPMGADFGTAVHAVFELVEASAPDLSDRLQTACATVVSRLPSGVLKSDELATALLPTFQTSLGPLAGGRRLADIGPGDRLAELGFELPLAGGDTPIAEVHLGLVADLLRRHLGADDPLAGYAALIDHPALAEQTLRGYLTGSIDAVLRIADDSGVPRYLVVDYKTNWLGTPGGVLTLADYAPDRMAEAMMHAHYPLQALLYGVAVHRMLRWRQPGYDPQRHLGGVLYLFVRGMAGPETPEVAGVPHGVFSWRPPAALVVELSDLLDDGGLAGGPS